jgi:hypothetical protein
MHSDYSRTPYFLPSLLLLLLPLLLPLLLCTNKTPQESQKGKKNGAPLLSSWSTTTTTKPKPHQQQQQQQPALPAYYFPLLNN